MKGKTLFAIATASILVLTSILPATQPAFTSAAPPPPASPTPTLPPSEPGVAGQPLHAAPSPDNLPPAMEETRARQAMEAVLEKYLRYWGPRYQVAPIEVTVEGEWAHGIAQWQSQVRTLRESIYILAHRLPEGFWQALMPSTDGLYLQWVDAIPESLVPDGEKSQLRTQAAEADALRRPLAPPVVQSTVISTTSFGEHQGCSGEPLLPPLASAQDARPASPTPVGNDSLIFLDNLLRVSPDGRYLAYVTAQDLGMTGSTIWIANIDGSGARRLVTGQDGFWVTNPIWSPDSTAIAYLRVVHSGHTEYEVDYRFEVWAVDLDGANNRSLISATLLRPSLGFGGEADIVWNSKGEIEFDDYSVWPVLRYVFDTEAHTLHETAVRIGLAQGSQIAAQPSNVPFFRQCDSQWGGNQLGTCSGDTICNRGCYVTSAAMVFKYFGVNTDPGTLNTWLTNNGGYDQGCLLNGWQAVNYHSNIHSFVRVDGEDWGRLNSELDAGYPVIAKVTNAYGDHFVVVTHRSSSTYYLNDPLAGGPDARTLADYGNHFQGLRIFHGNISSECSAPSLNSPNDGYVHTSSDRTITFSWSPPPDCTPDGYTFRVSTSSSMDIVPGLPDKGEGGTQTSHTFGSEWDNRDLWWSVRACKPCTPYNPGPWAPSRRFRIEPGAPPPPPPPPPPGEWHVEYFNDKNLGSRCYEGYESSTYVFKDWGEDAPAGGCSSDNWSARFTRRVHFQSGTYTFGLGSDDWGKIKLGSDTVVDNWQGAGQHYESRTLPDGDYDVTVEFADTLGHAKLAAWWWGPGFNMPRESPQSGQWYAEYWGNKDLWWDSIIRVNEGTGSLNHTWDTGGPGYGLPSDKFSARFSRTLHFACGRWRFNIFTDDGVRFWVDDDLVLDEWRDQVASFSPEVDLTTGDHQLRLDYYENGGSAAIHMSWEQLSGCICDPPFGLAALALSQSEVLVAWFNACSNPTGFKVYRDGTYVAQVGADARSYRDSGLACGTGYCYYVKATNPAGDSEPSNTACATTYACQTDVGPLVYDSHRVDDDTSDQSNGDNDGIVDCGETIELYVTLYNQGSDTATGVNAAISTSDSHVTWLHNTSSSYPDIAGGGTGTNTDDFDFEVDPDTPDGHVIHFDLDITASNGGPWSDSFNVPVACPWPDLRPYAPSGYPYPVVPSSIQGTHEVNTLYAGQPTYFDWHFINSGDATASGNFHVELWVDDTRYVRYPYSDYGAGWSGGFDDWAVTISTPGWHTVRLITDPDDTIAESDETNNVWERQFYWTPSAPYADDMEDGTNDWTATGLWHQVSGSSPYPSYRSPTHSWWYGQDATGDYDTGSANSGDLTSPPIYIPSTGYYLRFWYRYETETQGPDLDQRWVQISVDGGPFDNVLQLFDDPMNRWLQGPVIDLSGYAGHTIQVRFHFDTLDVYHNNYRGWYIDDFDISTAPPPSCADSHEPNNSSAQATTIAYGHSLNADICPGGDYDFYTFTGAAGDKVVVDIDAKINGSSLDSYIFLLDSDGTSVLAEHDDEIMYEVQDSHLGYHLPHDGTYYIKVKAWNHPSVGGTDYFYTIYLLTDDVNPSSAEITSPGNDAWLDPSVETITASASDDESGINRIEFLWHDADWENPDWVGLGADQDGRDGWSWDFETSSLAEQRDGAFYIWAFDWAGNWTGAAVWNLGIDRTPPTATASISPMYGDAPFCDFYVLWDGSDNLSDVASYDVQYRDGADGTWTDLLTGTTETDYRFVGQDGHTYYFRARARDYAGNESTYVSGDGDAQHTVQICTVAADAYEDDNTYTSARPIETGGAWQIHNIHTEEDQDWVWFTALPSITYTLATTNTGGHADTVLYLYENDGTTLIASNDDDPDNWPASHLEWRAPAGGAYYVKVDHWDPWAYGCTTEYGLSITPGPPLASSAWPMYQHDLRHSSQSPYNGPSWPALSWSYDTGPVNASPVIGPDGTVYIAEWYGTVYAFNPNGTLKWSYDTQDYIEYASAAIGADGTIYQNTDYALFALNPDGTLKWESGGCGGPSGPAIGDDGTVYSAGWLSGKLCAIRPDGTLKWSYETGNIIFRSSPAIAPDGTIYIGSSDKKLYALNPDGSLKWSYTTGDSVWSSPAIAADGTVYVGSNDGLLYAINPDGTLQWSSDVGIYGSSPVIAGDGTIYVTARSYLWVLDPDGSIKWSCSIGGQTASSPAIGANGIVYVGSSDNKLYAVAQDASILWSYLTGDRVESSPAIGSDGTIYVGSLDHKFYAISQGVPQTELEVTNIVVESGREYVAEKLSEGDTYYIDCPYVIEDIPAGFEGLIWIMTANDDKKATASSFLSFDINVDAWVYVAYDHRATLLPQWLEEFTPLGQGIGVTDGGASPLMLYGKQFSAGKVILGGNLAPGASGANSNYVVLLKAATPSPPDPPSLVSPANGASLAHDTDITLDWDSSSGATEYYAHLWGGSGVDINSGWISTSEWQVGPQQLGTYQWQVKARNEYGESDWSSTWSFTVTSELVVSNIWVASGKPYRAEKLGVGSHYYIDRDYEITSIPSGFEGLTWIMTANDDKRATSETFLCFDVNEAVDVFVAYDKRATSLPDWMSSFELDRRGISVSDHHASPLKLCRASYPAGTVILGGNMAPGASGAGSNYVVLVAPAGSVPPPLEVTHIVVESDREYEAERLSEGDTYYIDRPYVIEDIPAGFEGLIWIKTANDDKGATSESFLGFDVNKAVDVFIAYDKRATSLPDCMSSFALDGRSILVSDQGASPLKLYRKSYPAGTVTLGGNMASGASGAGSNYVVLIKSAE